MVAARGCRMFVGSDCLQRTAAAGVAWQRSVRCGTASEDGTCGIVIVGRLGWQRIAAGCLAWLGYPVRYIIERWHGRLLRLVGLAVAILSMGEARK